MKGQAPITTLEKQNYEKTFGAPILVPNYVPQGLKPARHTFEEGNGPSCYILRMVYETSPFSFDLEINQKSKRCASPNKERGFKSPIVSYEEISIPQFDSTLYYQSSDFAHSKDYPNDKYKDRIHFLSTNTSIIEIDDRNGNLPKEEVVKIIQSLTK